MPAFCSCALWVAAGDGSSGRGTAIYVRNLNLVLDSWLHSGPAEAEGGSWISVFQVKIHFIESIK